MKCLIISLSDLIMFVFFTGNVSGLAKLLVHVLFAVVLILA